MAFHTQRMWKQGYASYLFQQMPQVSAHPGLSVENSILIDYHLFAFQSPRTISMVSQIKFFRELHICYKKKVKYYS